MLTDLDSLLQPIRGDAPAGDDLSFSPDFDRIQEARREEDPGLDQGDWVRALKEADWAAVVSGATELLCARTKDLRLAAWLTEALARTDGFAGLAQGLALVARLTETYWDSLHPLPDGEDQDERCGNYSWLVQRTADLVRRMPLTASAQGGYSWADHKSAAALTATLDPDETAGDNRLTLAAFRAAQASTPRSFYVALATDFATLRENAGRFETAVDVRLGADGPAFSPLRKAIEEVGDLVEQFTRDAGLHMAGRSIASAADNCEAAASQMPIMRPPGSISSRAEALRQLRLVAEYFRHTEPHSPVAYLADKAARWGEIPLHLWLRQVIKDEGALARLEELLGLEHAATGHSAAE